MASLDKREFYQELAQAQNKIATTQKNIAEEIEKANGVESRKLEREIASMERKLAEMEEDLSRAVQNSPFKTEEKQLDINAKKRELEALKTKFSLDEKTYNSEKNNSEKLIASKIEDGQKVVKNTIENMSSEYSDMKNFHSEINKIFAFSYSSLTSDERSNAHYVALNSPGLRSEAEDLWRESERMIRDYNDFIFRINKNSSDVTTAEGVVNETIRTYQKLLETTDVARRAIEATEVGEGYGISQTELNSLRTTIAGMRNSVQSKIASLKTTRDDLLIVNSPEKIREKFLADLSEKKNALDTLRDSIIKAENAITQEERNIQVDGLRVIDQSLKREIADKQSAILDQKDAIANKKEDLEKMLSGKSEALENLRTTLKDQQSDLEKMLTKEESYEIRAPFSGTIRTIKIQVGDVIGNESADAERFVLLENSELINIKIALNQLDITKVSIGQEASISFEAVPEALLIGRITEISSTPARNESGGSASSYEVIISAERGEYAIYSGMNAQVTIDLESREDVILVPITAVSDDVVSGEQYVNVVADSGEIIKTTVQTGQKNNGQIEIISGVDVGQKIQVIDFNANMYTADDFTSSTGF